MLKHCYRGGLAAMCLVSVSAIALAQGTGQEGVTKERPTTTQTKPAPAAPSGATGAPQAPQTGTGVTTQQAPATTTKPGAAAPDSGQKPAAQQGAPTGADPKAGAAVDVKLSSEQETKLRSVVRTTTIREVTNINVSISIGTVLPATVVLEPIPAEIIAIVPQFRTYRIIRVGGRLLIVHPDTRRIVYIITI